MTRELRVLIEEHVFNGEESVKVGRNFAFWILTEKTASEMGQILRRRVRDLSRPSQPPSGKSTRGSGRRG